MVSTDDSLEDQLATILPTDHSFQTYHVSTPPAQTCALYTPPTGQKPERTHCESHLLLVTHIPQDSCTPSSVALFALEILIYTTKRLTTVFVSKADSTGFAATLPPTGASSILRSISSPFISQLVRPRLRPDRRLVISLFARAQDQYLFPGSAENKAKHVLSDRQLIKWWCRTLDPIVREYASTDSSYHSGAHLIVPGYDTRETTALFPPSPPHSTQQDGDEEGKWRPTHPLHFIAPYSSYTAPPRNLIPHFPDDPKSRFLLDLDDELSNTPATHKPSDGGEPKQQPSPSKRGTGQWKSVKSIKQFWEMMAWRQECSSGRAVGFLWITVTPVGLVGVPSSEGGAGGAGDEVPGSPSLRPGKRKRGDGDTKGINTEGKDSRTSKRRRKLEGPIIPRQPRVKSTITAHSTVPEKTAHFYWPKSSRGNIVVNEKAYERVHEILLRLDFTGREMAAASTKKWVEEVGSMSGREEGEGWGVTVAGRAAHSGVSRAGVGGVKVGGGSANGNGVQTLSSGLVRKKAPTASKEDNGASQVNDLGAGLVRKKPKMESAAVQMLGAGLVRKKAKS